MDSQNRIKKKKKRILKHPFTKAWQKQVWNKLKQVQTDVQPLKLIYNTWTLVFQSQMEYQVKVSILLMTVKRYNEKQNLWHGINIMSNYSG